MIDVDELCRLGKQAWPALDVPRDRCADLLATRPDADVAHASDLYLTFGCLAGGQEAIAQLHAHFLDTAEPYLAPLVRGSPLSFDEIRQELAIKLCVADGDRPPRLAAYGGTGPLAGWIRIAATRLAIDLMRRGRREQPASQPDDIERLVEAASVELDAELLLVRERYRVEFRSALEHALATLSAEHRAILRLHYLEHMTTAALAAVYRVSRNTIVRRIAEARTALFEGTFDRLGEAIGLPTDQHRSLLQLVRSQLELSIARLLAGA